MCDRHHPFVICPPPLSTAAVASFATFIEALECCRTAPYIQSGTPLRIVDTNLKTIIWEDDSVVDKPLDPNGVHQGHCCAIHGCKYGDRSCVVELQLEVQAYVCERCQEDGIEDMAMFDRVISGQQTVCPHCCHVLTTPIRYTAFRAAPKCKGCGKPITAEHVTDWHGFCDDCIESGRNLTPDNPPNPT